MLKHKSTLTTFSLAVATTVLITSGAFYEKKILAEPVTKVTEQTTKTDQKAKIVSTARTFLDQKYVWGGRNTKSNPGIDCLGVLFLSLQETYGIPWQKFSVYPSKLLKQLHGNETRVLVAENTEHEIANKIGKLHEGDFVFFLASWSNDDKPVVTIPRKSSTDEKIELSVWHTAIYSGKGNIIHSSPFDDNYEVVEEPLGAFMKRHHFQGFIAKEPIILKNEESRK